jgi:integrase
MRQRLDSIFGFAIASGYARENPAAQIIKAMSPMPPGGRMPAIVDIDEAREMLRRVESAPAFPLVKAANRFIALTAVRLGEARFAKWSEIQGDVWELSAPRMKMSRPHRVPLSPAALEILTTIKPLSGRSEYIFTTSKGPVRPMGDNSIGSMINRAGYAGRHCAHGWRSLFSTYANTHRMIDVPPGVNISDIVEAALSHESKNAVRAAYMRSDYFELRRELMNAWSDVLLAGAVPLEQVLSGARK